MRRLLMVLVLLAAPTIPVRAADASIEDRLRALEERIRVLEEENAALRGTTPGQAPPSAPSPASEPPAPAAPKPAPVAVLAAGKERDVKLGGFLQVQAEAGSRPDQRFSDAHDRIFLRRARLNVQGHLLEELEWRTEIELAGTLANSSALRAQLTDAYVAWHATPHLDLRAGQFKTPWGFEHLWSDTKLAFAERTLGSDRLTLGREAGVELSGKAWTDRFTWNVGVFDGTPANTSGNDDERFLVAARAWGTPLKWTMGQRDGRWSIGAGAYRSEDRAASMGPEFGFDAAAGGPLDNVFEGSRTADAIDTQIVLGRFEIWSEWLHADFEPRNAIPRENVNSYANMAQVSVLSFKDRLQLSARYDRFDPDTEIRTDDIHGVTAGAAWLFRSHDIKLQANWMNVESHVPGVAGSRVLVRMQVVF